MKVLYIVELYFIITFVLMWLRRKYLKAFNEEPGKSMYAAERHGSIRILYYIRLFLMLSFFRGREVQIVY